MLKVFLLVAVFSMLIIPVNAQTVYEFGYQQHPGKLLENSEGILQIYVKTNEFMIPKNISDLQVTSSNRQIVEVLDVQMYDNFSTNVKLKANKSGTTNISVAAPGYSSQEIPITVYSSNNNPNGILIKATPNDFAIDGPKFGYLTVELITSGNLPTKANDEIIIKLESPNSDIIQLKDKELRIGPGEYFAITQFEIRDSGDALIFAKADQMKSVSERIHVREPEKPLTISLYTYPSNYLTGTNNKGYAIVQLEDASGIPVKATEDIPIRIAVENPEATKNSSHDFEEIIFEEKQLIIKEGKYSTYTSFTPRPDFADLIEDYKGNNIGPEQQIVKSFSIGISAEDYHVKGNSIQITHDSYVGEMNGKGPVLVSTLPFLVTGEKEIIGVAYLETDVEVSKQKPDGSRFTDTVTVPVMADEKFTMHADSSGLETVSIIDPEFKTGDNVALIFGNTGTVIPDGTSLEFTFEDNEGIKTFQGLPEGPIEDDISIVTESLVPEVMAGEEFFILSYMNEASSEDDEVVSEEDEEDEDGRLGPTHFISDTVLTFSASDIVEVEPKIIKQNDAYALLNAKALKVGDASLSGTAGKFETGISIKSKTTDPTSIFMSHMKNIFPGTTSLATIQLLDSANNPVYVKNDIDIKLVSDGTNSIKIPEIVTIGKGEYYTTFEIKGINDGNINISALSEDFPMAKFPMNIVSVNPNLQINSIDSVEPNKEITAQLKLAFDGLELPLSDYNVKWDIVGASIKQMDEKTNEQGIAKIDLLAVDPKSIIITAHVSGQSFFESTVTKSISVIQPASQSSEVQNDKITKESESDRFLTFDQKNAVFIIIPVAIGAAVLFLKKTNRLDEILERVSFGERLEEIKEKVSNLKDR